MRQIMKHVSILWMGQRNPPVENGGKHPIIYSWLVVWNIFYFSFHIWDVILPIDELHHFSRWAHCTTNQIMPESPSAIEVLLKFYDILWPISHYIPIIYRLSTCFKPSLKLVFFFGFRWPIHWRNPKPK